METRNLFGITAFSDKNKTEEGKSRSIKLMLELTAGCVALLAVRFYRTESPGYIFLVWNLFLAWVPFFMMRFFVGEITDKKTLLQNVLPLLTWLAFLPNAPYILTDLFHLRKSAAVPQWFDLILILSFALTGMVLLYLSFLEFEKKIALLVSTAQMKWLRISVFLAVGYGLYLGRYLRYNSWDIISEPGHLFRGIYNSLFSQDMIRETLGVTFFFAVFLYFGYKLFFLLADHRIVKKKAANDNE